HLTIRGFKIIADGGLGARSAALLHPYADDPANGGLIRVPEEEIYQLAKKAIKAGFQMAVHGVGDRTNRAIINAYERAFKGVSSPADFRFRIEHASIMDPTDIPRIAKLGVITVMQPTFCRTQCSYVGARVGLELAQKGAFPWRTLVNSGVRIVGSSDSP